MKKALVILALSSTLPTMSYAQTCPHPINVASQLSTLTSGLTFAKTIAQNTLIKNKNGQYPVVNFAKTQFFSADLVKTEERSTPGLLICNYQQRGSEKYDILYSIALEVAPPK